ncbi:MAG TPA: hypothetical protein VK307_10415 [Thermoleophilaceae bacterium]|nr:hypothetical protein [Thermoleophilaceae bacterium]
MRRLLAVALALAGAAAGCGGANDDEATALLERGFSADVQSGVLALSVHADLDGLPLVRGPIEVDLAGPFDNYRRNEIPRLDWDATVSAAGREIEGGLVLGADNGWVEFQGDAYEIGEDRWAELWGETAVRRDQTTDLRPIDAIRNAEIEGNEDVNGVSTTHVVADVDPGEYAVVANELVPGGPEVRDGERLAELWNSLVEKARLDAWIAGDGIWRRASVEIELDVPKEHRDALAGLERGALTIDVELSEPNEPQEIQEPDDARPLSELLGKLGLGALLLPS